jgi:hypothetical protein
MILKNLETAIRARLDALGGGKQRITNALIGINKALTRQRLRPALSRRLSGRFTPASGRR